MSIADIPLRIVQISDIHCGEITFDRELMIAITDRVNAIDPDLVVVAGDLTAAGYEWEFEEAVELLGRIHAPKVIVPGNHDARNVGYIHFERFFGDRFSTFRTTFDPERAERLRASGMTVVAVDSSEPDLQEGQVGRERYPWIREQYAHPGDLRIFVIHHHLVSIPGTGRERNTINDAGDVLAELSELEIDIILCGHKHVPFFWGLNGMLLCNSGTATTKRVRGLTPPSWNELEVDASQIKVYLHYPDGRRELSVIRSRTTRTLIREAFYLTDDFLQSNRLLSTGLPHTGPDPSRDA